MHLILDFGNLLLKYYVFDNHKIIHQKAIELNLWRSKLKTELPQFPKINAVMISDVSGWSQEDLIQYFSPLTVVFCSLRLKLPFKSAYENPDQLGADRVGLVAAACLLYPDSDTLIIDMGSCITYDFVDRKKYHWGGAISPGFLMRYKSVCQFSGNLPLLSPETPKSQTENSTEGAIHSGIYYGILSEIEYQIKHYRKKTSDLALVLTGGDANKLSKQLKNSIFVNSNFLAKGLNSILEKNKF